MESSGGRRQVEVLGPLRITDADGVDITPTGALPRRLTALLVLHRGRVVSADAAIEALWPGPLPRDPAAALHNHVFRVRRFLPGGLIESVGHGYRLDHASVDVDVDRLAAALTTPDPAEIDALLDRWHGPAYPELAEVGAALVEVARLDEMRTRAREVRAQFALDHGRPDEVLPDLVALADEQPLRERPRSLLMAALATAGRRVEALRVFDDFRRLLGDELGTTPSPSLVSQHAALLVADPPDAVRGTATRLPAPTTRLIGRARLTADVTELVDHERLVTLVGPGGVGKTRLLLEVGRRLEAARTDRAIVLCELATADEASAVDVVATALDIDGRPGVALVDRVVDVLGSADVVLLVDNCEHVLPPTATLVERLLGSCPNVRIVATSRERLRVAGEHVRVVPTLPFDGERGAAVELFLDRTRAVAPGFAPTDAHLACIAEIVERLDGLPLAIELAAARMHTMELREIATGIDERFALLSSGYRTSARHASLGAAMAWSVDLLDEPLRRSFADLSVFARTFGAEDAAAVFGTDAASATGTLAQLVERSLVMRAPDRRYVLLETLRAFGAERLAADGRAETVGLRHAHHLLDWIERAERRLGDPGQRVLAEIDAAVPELRTALGRLLDHGDVERAGRLVSALIDYGFLRVRPDVLVWSERVIAADPDDRIAAASRVWVAAAYTAWMAGDIAATTERANRAFDIAERRDGNLSPDVMEIVGSAALFEGRLDDATRWYLRSADTAGGRDPAHRVLTLASAVMSLGYAGDPAATDLADTLLTEIGDATTPHAAYAWYCAGEADLAFDADRARVRLGHALHLAELTNASIVTGIAGASKASLDARIGDPLAAAADYRRLIEHWRRAGMWSTQWTMLRSIAGLLARLGRFDDAAVLEGAVRSPTAGHRIFGADEVALAELSERLREALGDDAYDAARRQGAVLDGDAAVEHALRSL